MSKTQAPTPTAPNEHPSSVTSTPGADTDLPQLLTSAILNVHGVLRLEPSMKDLLHKASPTRLRRSGPRAHDGLSISTFGTITDVTIDAAITTPRQAVTTAREIQDTVQTLLRQHNMEPGRIEVNILALEYEETNERRRPR